MKTKRFCPVCSYVECRCNDPAYMPPIPDSWCTRCFYVKCRCEGLLKRERLLEAIAKRTGPVTKIGLTPRQRRQALELCEAILESLKRGGVRVD